MDIIKRVQTHLPALPKKLALAARYAVDYPERIALNSMRGTAQEVGVTSTTMLRLARQLGFDSYEAFRASFQTQLVSGGFGTRAGALHKTDADRGTGSLASRIRAAAQQNVDATLSEANLANLAKAADLVRAAPSCILIGSGAAHIIAMLMKSTGAMVLPNLRLVGPEFAVAAEDIGPLGSRDVVIAFGMNPCATRTIDGLQFSKDQGARTIAITDRPSSPLAAHAEIAFFADTLSPHYYPSMAAMVVLVETLLATIVANGGLEEQARIAAFEQHRKAADSYVEY